MYNINAIMYEIFSKINCMKLKTTYYKHLNIIMIQHIDATQTSLLVDENYDNYIPHEFFIKFIRDKDYINLEKYKKVYDDLLYKDNYFLNFDLLNKYIKENYNYVIFIMLYLYINPFDLKELLNNESTNEQYSPQYNVILDYNFTLERNYHNNVMDVYNVKHNKLFSLYNLYKENYINIDCSELKCFDIFDENRLSICKYNAKTQKCETNKYDIHTIMPKTLNKIYGINTIYKFNIPELNKTIYLFGEEHIHPEFEIDIKSEINVCELLLSLPNNHKDINFDIFLETPYISNYNKYYTQVKQISYMQDYITIIKPNCLQINKEKCPYKNVRFHYMDIRSSLSSEFYKYMYMIHLDHMSIHDKNILFLNKNPTFSIFFNNLLIKSKIGKNLSKIKDIKLRKHLYNIFYFKLRNFYRMLTNNTEYIYDLFALVMDFYTVVRMFMTFLDNTTPKNIIYYAGTQHIKNVAKVLSLINSKLYDTDEPQDISVTEEYNYINPNNELWVNIPHSFFTFN